ncbi:MAG: hypothetical protein LWW94_09100 [Candidatus Desulfofervidaceae bacterium]|nr:hypothetical protein [Candidatus Desulfofervidaceae bacterium]
MKEFCLSSKKDLRPVLQVGHAWLIQEVVFTPDGRILISGSDTEIKCWDVKSGRLLKSIKHSENGWLLAMGIKPDGKTLITISRRSGQLAIKFWDIRTGKFIKTLKPIKDYDWACLSADGRFVSLCKGKIKEISRGEEKFRICMDRIEIMDIESGKKFRTFTEYATRAVKISPDGKTLAVAGKKRIRLLNIETGNLIKVFKTGDDLYGIAFVLVQRELDKLGFAIKVVLNLLNCSRRAALASLNFLSRSFNLSSARPNSISSGVR